MEAMAPRAVEEIALHPLEEVGALFWDSLLDTVEETLLSPCQEKEFSPFASVKKVVMPLAQVRKEEDVMGKGSRHCHLNH